MTWFKVDDSFYRSAKVRKLGNERVSAVGLWTLSGDWSADNLTDGFVPWEVVEDWDPRRKLARALVRVGLWFEADHDGEPGVRFHDWDDWQPTKDQVIQRRKADAERRARWRESRRHAGTQTEPDAASRTAEPDTSRQVSRRDSRVTSHDSSRQESRSGSVLPDPTRPDPTRFSFGELGGGGLATHAADARAASTPAPHDPPCEQPCRRCRDARLVAEHLAGDPEAERLAELARRHACRRCDPDGWLVDPQHLHRGPTNVRCDHQPTLRSVTA